MNPRLELVAFRSLLALLLAAFAVAGCGTVSDFPPAPTQVGALSSERYMLNTLDTLNVVVWRNPELSATVTVRPDGKISLPLVEDLQAAGRNPSDLSRDVERALAKFIRDPVVSIVVSGFQTAYTEQIRIVGEAARPQSIPYRRSMTVLDVIIQSGGMTDFADGNRAVLVRGAEGGKQYSLRLKDLIKRGDVSANVEMRPGDVIIIPQSWF